MTFVTHKGEMEPCGCPIGEVNVGPFCSRCVPYEVAEQTGLELFATIGVISIFYFAYKFFKREKEEKLTSLEKC